MALIYNDKVYEINNSLILSKLKKYFQNILKKDYSFYENISRNDPSNVSFDIIVNSDKNLEEYLLDLFNSKGNLYETEFYIRIIKSNNFLKKNFYEVLKESQEPSIYISYVKDFYSKRDLQKIMIYDNDIYYFDDFLDDLKLNTVLKNDYSKYFNFMESQNKIFFEDKFLNNLMELVSLSEESTFVKGLSLDSFYEMIYFDKDTIFDNYCNNFFTNEISNNLRINLLNIYNKYLKNKDFINDNNTISYFETFCKMMDSYSEIEFNQIQNYFNSFKFDMDNIFEVDNIIGRLSYQKASYKEIFDKLKIVFDNNVSSFYGDTLNEETINKISNFMANYYTLKTFAKKDSTYYVAGEIDNIFDSIMFMKKENISNIKRTFEYILDFDNHKIFETKEYLEKRAEEEFNINLNISNDLSLFIYNNNTELSRNYFIQNLIEFYHKELKEFNLSKKELESIYIYEFVKNCNLCPLEIVNNIIKDMESQRENLSYDERIEIFNSSLKGLSNHFHKNGLNLHGSTKDTALSMLNVYFAKSYEDYIINHFDTFQRISGDKFFINYGDKNLISRVEQLSKVNVNDEVLGIIVSMYANINPYLLKNSIENGEIRAIEDIDSLLKMSNLLEDFYNDETFFTKENFEKLKKLSLYERNLLKNGDFEDILVNAIINYLDDTKTVFSKDLELLSHSSSLRNLNLTFEMIQKYPKTYDTFKKAHFNYYSNFNLEAETMDKIRSYFYEGDLKENYAHIKFDKKLEEIKQIIKNLIDNNLIEDDDIKTTTIDSLKFDRYISDEFLEFLIEKDKEIEKELLNFDTFSIIVEKFIEERNITKIFDYQTSEEFEVPKNKEEFLNFCEKLQEGSFNGFGFDGETRNFSMTDFLNYQVNVVKEKVEKIYTIDMLKDIIERNLENPGRLNYRESSLSNLFKIENRGRVPKILSILENIKEKYGLTDEQIVHEFNFKLIKSKNLTSFGNPYLFDLYYNGVDFNKLTDNTVEALAIALNQKSIKNMISLIPWINEYANETSKENIIKIMSSPYEIEKGVNVLDTQELLDFITNARGKMDCKLYEEDYDFKFSDNTCVIEDASNTPISDGKYKIYILPIDSYEHFTVGYDTHCCQHYGGAGESCVYEAVTSPYASTLVIKNNNDEVVAQAFIWLDKEKEILVLDNIEFANDRDIKQFIPIIRAYLEASPYEEIHMGTRFNEAKIGMEMTKNGLATFDGITKRYCYTDYDGNAVILKKDGIVTLNEQDINTYNVKQKEKQEEKEKIKDLDL